MRYNHTTRRLQAGFTLIELLVEKVASLCVGLLRGSDVQFLGSNYPVSASRFIPE